MDEFPHNFLFPLLCNVLIREKWSVIHCSFDWSVELTLKVNFLCNILGLDMSFLVANEHFSVVLDCPVLSFYPVIQFFTWKLLTESLDRLLWNKLCFFSPILPELFKLSVEEEHCDRDTQPSTGREDWLLITVTENQIKNGQFTVLWNVHLSLSMKARKMRNQITWELDTITLHVHLESNKYYSDVSSSLASTWRPDRQTQTWKMHYNCIVSRQKSRRKLKTTPKLEWRQNRQTKMYKMYFLDPNTNTWLCQWTGLNDKEMLIHCQWWNVPCNPPRSSDIRLLSIVW